MNKIFKISKKTPVKAFLGMNNDTVKKTLEQFLLKAE